MKRNYNEGATVKAGQSLFTIDPAPFQSALARAEADVAGAEARYAQATRNAKRLKPLFDAKAVSQKEYDDAVSGEEIAAAEVKAAVARRVDANLNLSYTRVESPVTGATSRALKSEGTLISGGCPAHHGGAGRSDVRELRALGSGAGEAQEGR